MFCVLVYAQAQCQDAHTIIACAECVGAHADTLPAVCAEDEERAFCSSCDGLENTVTIDGVTFATIDDNATDSGLACDHPSNPGNDNDQCCQGDNFYPLPGPAWTLAEPGTTTASAVASHDWSTACVVLSDGSSYYTTGQGGAYPPGSPCLSNQLLVQNNTYGVGTCDLRVFIQCSAAGSGKY